MWSYYGAKTNIAHLYPPPKYGKIIEPFAGTARYALKYWEREVLLVDKYEVIVKIWKWLQKCSPRDITGLPRIKAGQNINDFKFDCEEARLFMGFCIGFGFHRPRQLATPRLRDRPGQQDYTLRRISGEIWKIKHWRVEYGSYEGIPNQPATWFIDPPYQSGGHAYRESNKNIDFPKLGEWCKERQGQVIVCEGGEAGWLPFIPLTTQNVMRGERQEVFWTNEQTSYNVEQKKLFSDHK